MVILQKHTGEYNPYIFEGLQEALNSTDFQMHPKEFKGVIKGTKEELETALLEQAIENKDSILQEMAKEHLQNLKQDFHYEFGRFKKSYELYTETKIDLTALKKELVNRIKEELEEWEKQ